MKLLLLIFLVFASMPSFAALSKVDEVDEIRISPMGICQIRIAHKVYEDGKLLAQSFERTTIEPEGDLSKADNRAKAVCNAAWTPQIISRWNAHKAKIAAEGLPRATP